MKDIIIIIVLIVLILICILLLKTNENRKKKDKVMEKSKLDMMDLEKITKNIEETYKPVNIKLTSYEQEQEDNAIISYEELVTNAKTNVNYESEYTTDTDVSVKKIDLENQSYHNETQQISITMLSYEKEEAFLKALKQLQSNLAR